MKIIEAPNLPNFKEYHNPQTIKIFLAGGITNCPNWQKEVIEELKKYNLDNVLIFNPRRDNFDVKDPTASEKQIAWEFKFLNEMDLFTMYFSAGESTQPICMYELGRHLERMQHRFPRDWRQRILVGVEDGYCRKKDVEVQMSLATGLYPCVRVSPKAHAKTIALYCNLLQQQKEIERYDGSTF